MYIAYVYIDCMYQYNDLTCPYVHFGKSWPPMQEQEPSKAPPNHARRPTGFVLPADSITAEG